MKKLFAAVVLSLVVFVPVLSFAGNIEVAQRYTAPLSIEETQTAVSPFTAKLMSMMPVKNSVSQIQELGQCMRGDNQREVQELGRCGASNNQVEVQELGRCSQSNNQLEVQELGNVRPVTRCSHYD